MKVCIGGKRRNDGSYKWRVEIGSNILSGTYKEVLDYVGKIYGGSKLDIKLLAGGYEFPGKKKLMKLKVALGLERAIERKIPKIEHTTYSENDGKENDEKIIESIPSGTDENDDVNESWEEIVRKADERLKKIDAKIS